MTAGQGSIREGVSEEWKNGDVRIAGVKGQIKDGGWNTQHEACNGDSDDDADGKSAATR